MSEREQRMSSWGYKFEQYMQTDTPTSEKANVRQIRGGSGRIFWARVELGLFGARKLY
jgi:hypothetical protein